MKPHLAIFEAIHIICADFWFRPRCIQNFPLCQHFLGFLLSFAFSQTHKILVGLSSFICHFRSRYSRITLKGRILTSPGYFPPPPSPQVPLQALKSLNVIKTDSVWRLSGGCLRPYFWKMSGVHVLTCKGLAWRCHSLIGGATLGCRLPTLTCSPRTSGNP